MFLAANIDIRFEITKFPRTLNNYIINAQNL